MLIGSDNVNLLEHLHVIMSNQSPLVGVEMWVGCTIIGPEFCCKSAQRDRSESGVHTASITSATGHADIYNELETYFYKEFNEERNDEELTTSVEDNRACDIAENSLSLEND